MVKFKMRNRLLIFGIVVFSISCVKNENEEILASSFLSGELRDSTCFYLGESDFENYEIPDLCADLLVHEKFSNNDAGWFEGDQSSARVVLSGGRYLGSSENVNFLVPCPNCELDNGRGFQIEVEISGDKNENFSSLNWGGESFPDNLYIFGISEDKEYLIAKIEDGRPMTFIQPKTFSSLLRGSSNNKITIRYIDGITYFFVNEIFLSKFDYLLPFGEEISLMIGSGSECAFDDLKVFQLFR
jgi:hypothetical protein